MRNTQFSRREILKVGILSSVAITGTVSLVSCNDSSDETKNQSFPNFIGENWNAADGVAGLLFSQLGYELGLPVRVVVRLPQKKCLPGNVNCILIPSTNENRYKAECKYWGEVWKSHWWIAEFSEINEVGEWDVEIVSKGKCLFRDKGLEVATNILWDKTIEWSSVDMLERRRHFTKVGAGWQDAGTLWVEIPAQSAMIIALEELLDKSFERFDKPFINRIYVQITVGCDYLLMTQKKAIELGFAKGSFTHDLHGHEKEILPNDAMKAVVALAKAARLLPDKFKEKRIAYQNAATLAFDWLLHLAKPMGDYGFSKFQRGIPEDIKIPNDEWPTRDLLVLCSAALEIWKLNNSEAKNIAVDFARQIIGRQIPKENAENGFYGHFYEFSSMSHSETSWTQGIVNSQFGADIGGVYPNYLMPLIELVQLFPKHNDSGKWQEALANFANGYLIPACEKNPFLIVPQGIFEEEGPIWFCGTFHGTNSIYGYTASLALELADLLSAPKLRNIAYGNLQWLAGLNAGITRENVKLGSVVYSTNIPKGAALPASMICNIGKRWAGTWFQTRGVICNGFSTGRQFVYDVEPKKENDGPFSFTDEDWIPHSAGWLTGLTRL